ncbi:hypothetical protein [Suttonella ornithocola]|uniref:Uncharacterized protein n=1 Tax=Suttonella ornithocola TaxID=279832 RepID=A0A380MVI3_9GAMM|nr:hypothetical protein [Suttonella ornithocola]SUO95711.1 Uncharacterised protein [Suttonella ornithocola]
MEGKRYILCNTLKNLSLIIYSLALLTPVYPPDSSGIMPGIVILILGVQWGWMIGVFAPYANLIYFWIMIKDKRAPVAVILMLLLASQALLSDKLDGSDIDALGIGFYYWFVALIIMAVAGLTPPEKVITLKQHRQLKLLAVVLSITPLIINEIHYQQANAKERDKYGRFGMFYMRLPLSGVKTIVDFERLEPLPQNALIEVFNTSEHPWAVSLPDEVVENGKLQRGWGYSRDMLIKSPLPILREITHRYEQYDIGKNKVETRLIRLRDGKEIFRQQWRFYQDREYSFWYIRPRINDDLLIQHIQSPSLPVFNWRKIFATSPTLTACSERFQFDAKNHSPTIFWHDYQIHFADDLRENAFVRLYCQGETVLMLKKDSYYSSLSAYLFDYSDMVPISRYWEDHNKAHNSCHQIDLLEDKLTLSLSADEPEPVLVAQNDSKKEILRKNIPKYMVLSTPDGQCQFK